MTSATTEPVRAGEAAEALDVCSGHSMASQFGHPHGVLGWLAGHLMARKNAGLNSAAVGVLEVRDGDRVLEIGFGHGRTVREIARSAAGVFVAGIDPSATMVRQASGRNRALMREGTVDLKEASVASIPYSDASFTKVLAVNSFQHWPEAIASLREVRRVLRPGGSLVLGLRMHVEGAGRFTAPGFTEREVDITETLVRDAGFREVRRARCEAGRALTCLVAVA